MTSLPADKVDLDGFVFEINRFIHPEYKLVVALVDEGGIYYVDVCDRETGNDINPRYIMITNDKSYPHMQPVLERVFTEAEEVIRKYGFLSKNKRR